jgi:hypothetical protein
LRHRIIELEWCVREGKPFDKSPKSKSKKGKPAKKGRSSKTRSGTSAVTPVTEETEAAAPVSDGEDKMEVEDIITSSPPRRTRSKAKAESGTKEESPEPVTFGTDTTNGGSPGKRPRVETPTVKAEEREDSASPPASKRTRRSEEWKQVEIKVDESEEEDLDIIRPRRSKRTAAAAAR